LEKTKRALLLVSALTTEAIRSASKVPKLWTFLTAAKETSKRFLLNSCLKFRQPRPLNSLITRVYRLAPSLRYTLVMKHSLIKNLVLAAMLIGAFAPARALAAAPISLDQSLVDASKRGDLVAIRWLVAHGANPNFRDPHALISPPLLQA